MNKNNAITRPKEKKDRKTVIQTQWVVGKYTFGVQEREERDWDRTKGFLEGGK